MSDPLARKTDTDESPLFSQRQSTSHIAAGKAAPRVGSRRRRIVERLRIRPSTIFEVAESYRVPDHTISGRFSELAKDGHIELASERRPHPRSGCPGEVWRVAGLAVDHDADAGELLGYPLTLNIGGDLYDRQRLLPSESYPAIPYVRRADSGGVKQVVRVEIAECPACGRPLRMLEEKGSKFFRCINDQCLKTWHAKAVNEPGRAAILALVAFTM